MATVGVRNIQKYFGEVLAVDGVDLATKEGEFLVRLGPSGCGKTTLMRIIAGLEKPTDGDILIDGQVVTHLPPRARKIAMVFQSYTLYPHLTVFKNIAFPLKAQGVPKAARQQKVEWAAAMFGIERLLQRKLRQLSGANATVSLWHTHWDVSRTYFCIAARLMSFQFCLTRIEYLGADRLIYGILEASFATHQKVIANLPATVTMTLHPGACCQFAVLEPDLKFFDRTTGLRVAPPVGNIVQSER